MLFIANAYVMNPATGEEGYQDILIEGSRIVKMGENLYDTMTKNGETEGLQIIDATGLVAAPGLVDVHVHFRDPGFTYKEDIETGAKAALKGGYTTVVLMANTKPVADNAETLAYVLEKGQKTGLHVETCACVTRGMKGQELTDMEQLFREGAAGFTDDGVPVLTEEIVKSAMQEAGRLGVPISFHEENPAFIENNGVNAGAASAHYQIGGSKREAEIDLVRRDLALALKTGACVNIQHISTKEAVELIRQAKAKGGDIHAEATPHHFTLTEEAVIRYGTLAKMNPPLREESDRMAIIEGLKDGTIDLIATDHAPHSREEKARPITEAPSGIIGLETALALGITYLVDTGQLSLMSLLEKMTINPARMYHFDAGYLAEGAPADIVLFDPQESFIVDGFASKSENSPFLGWRLRGKVKYTICGGESKYEDSCAGKEEKTRKERIMHKKKLTAAVKSQREIAPHIYDLRLSVKLAADAKAGQFVCLYPKDKSTLLPRPISICEADGESGILRLVYRVAGKGTAEFSRLTKGETVEVLGNLGNGFPVEEAAGKRVFIMGGGIGIPPMLELAKRLQADKQIIVGYRDRDTFLKEELEQYGSVYVATEDGSVGSRGNVMDAIRENGLCADVIYACGPMPMLRAIKKYAEEQGIPAYISLEEHMACGVGACLGCVVKTKKVDSHSHVNNARICTDGPVFEAGEVDI